MLHNINEAQFELLEKRLADAESVEGLAERFKALGDTTRLQIVLALKQEDLCVHDLARLIGTSESNTSHQLRILRSLKIVKFRKEGKQSIYSIDDEHITHLIEDMQEHLSEE